MSIKRKRDAPKEDTTIHKAAKVGFDALDVKKLPKVKELSVEYGKVLTAKKKIYAEYRQAKNEA